jgi:putative ABC transport system substrate-binding protein
MTLLGGAAAWPLAARAQQSGKLPMVGFLGAATLSTWSAWIAAFVERLREVGWIENRTIALEYRWAQGREERFAEFSAEFVRLKVDVIDRCLHPEPLGVLTPTTTLRVWQRQGS